MRAIKIVTYGKIIVDIGWVKSTGITRTKNARADQPISRRKSLLYECANGYRGEQFSGAIHNLTLTGRLKVFRFYSGGFFL